MISRRKIMLTFGAGVLAVPRIPFAQANPLAGRRIGILTPLGADSYRPLVNALRDLGYEDGKNVRLLLRAAEADYARLPALARELVEAKADVIVAINTPGARAAIDATRTIPVVMTHVGDPIGSGFVTSLARPGGNVTGVSNLMGELGSKRLAVLHELLPGAKRIAVLYNPVDPVTEPQIRDVKSAAPKLGVELRFYPVKTPASLPETFNPLLEWRAQAAIWLNGQHQSYQAGTIALAAKHKLPLMAAQTQDVDQGGLLGYTADLAQMFKRTASHVDKILKGAKVGEFPVEQTTQFELAINLKTAKALGIKVPQSILIQATKVIE